MPNLVSPSHSSLQISGKTQMRVFLISGFLVNPLIKEENCHNSRATDKIQMKLGSLTKLEKRHKIMLKKSNDDIMPTNCDVITIFPIYGQFAVTWKIPDS